MSTNKQDPRPVADEDQKDEQKEGDDEPDTGVDVSLIRWMLSLTPEQRLEWLQDHAQAMLELRDAYQKS